MGCRLARAAALILVALAAGCGGADKAEALREADRIAAALPVYPGAAPVERGVVEYDAPDVGLPWEAASGYDRVLEYRLRSRGDVPKVLAFFARNLGAEWTAAPIERGIGIGCWYRDGASVTVMTEHASPRVEFPSYTVVVGTSQLGVC